MLKSCVFTLFSGVMALTLLTTPATAQSEGPQEDTQRRERAGQAAREGMASILRALDLLLLSIPLYASPEVLENGDIIIRRLPRNEPGTPPDTPPNLPEAYGENDEIDM